MIIYERGISWNKPWKLHWKECGDAEKSEVHLYCKPKIFAMSVIYRNDQNWLYKNIKDWQNICSLEINDPLEKLHCDRVIIRNTKHISKKVINGLQKL